VLERTYSSESNLRHPDKNLDDPSATAKFQKINNAYRRLTESDDEADSLDGDEDEARAVRSQLDLCFVRLVKVVFLLKKRQHEDTPYLTLV
jgi:hypothetical protein